MFWTICLRPISISRYSPMSSLSFMRETMLSPRNGLVLTSCDHNHLVAFQTWEWVLLRPIQQPLRSWLYHIGQWIPSSLYCDALLPSKRHKEGTRGSLRTLKPCPWLLPIRMFSSAIARSRLGLNRYQSLSGEGFVNQSLNYRGTWSQASKPIDCV